MRLIDADSLLKHLFVTESRTGGSVYAQAYEQGWDDALKAVMENEPTVTYAVDVVRCKDCNNASKCHREVIMRSRGGGNIYCHLEFCSEGERREDA